MVAVTQILTHPGAAHRDEFLACCLFIASPAGNRVTSILRKDVKAEHLTTPNVLVLDQGGSYDLELHNLDHHQFDRKAAASCSITQVLELMADMDVQLARKIWPWLEFSEYLDSKGPAATACQFRIDPDSMHKLQSPVENYILREFQNRTRIRYTEDLFKLMSDIGTSLLMHYYRTELRLRDLQSELVFHSVPCDAGDYQVADVRVIRPEDQPLLGLEIYLQDYDGDCPVTVSQDDRNYGLCLYRRNDDVRIDFSLIEHEPDVRFAHKNGFIAKLKPGADWKSLLIKSHSNPRK